MPKPAAVATPGSLIEYLQQKKVVCAFCVKHDKKGNLLVRTEDNRQDRVGRNKVLFHNTTALDPEGPPEPMIELCKQTSEKREQLAQELELEELWELLAAEDPEVAWPLEDLSGFLYGDDEVDTEALSALYRALHNDSTYFLRKGDEYKPRPPEQVEEIKTRIQVEAQRGLEREAVGNWIREVWNGGRRSQPAEFPAGFEEAGERYLQQLKDLAIYGNDAPRAKDTQRLLKELDITRRDAPFRWLVKAGFWDEHENLQLHEYRTPIEFSAEVEEAAAQAVERLAEVLEQPGRRSLEEAFTVTIDDAFTTEVDDALSLQRTESGWQIGVHIAEASAFVEPESLLDQEARVRGTSIYLPSRKIRMLPDCLGDVVCSLTEGERRPAFSFIFELDADLNIVDRWMGPTTVRVDRRLTYDQADAELAGKPDWGVLLDFAEKCRQARRDQGAITVPFPRSQIRVEDGTITIELENPHSVSQVLVSEMMILANRTAAEYFVEQQVPAIFRFQQPPEKEIPPETEFDPVTLYGLRRLFRKGETGYAPSRHAGLGLDAYTQVTSPIRRYGDLLMQRQLKSSLAEGRPLYDDEALKERCLTLSQSTSQAEGMERQRKYYWALVYLEERRHQEMRAVVLANQGDRNWVQLVDVLMETDCPAVGGRSMPPGTEFLVRIEQVFPRDRTLRVSASLEED